MNNEKRFEIIIKDNKDGNKHMIYSDIFTLMSVIDKKDEISFNYIDSNNSTFECFSYMLAKMLTEMNNLHNPLKDDYDIETPINRELKLI